MPMHLRLDSAARVVRAGPTMRRVCEAASVTGADFFALFDIRRPRGVTTAGRLRALDGTALKLALRAPPFTGFKGTVVALDGSDDLLVNLSFGINLPDGVRDHALTDRDFAITDLAVEMLYLNEAKLAVLGELRSLNHRLRSAKQRAEEQAVTDALTGLANRRAAEARLQQMCESGQPFAAMQLDLDRFKQVNDTLGHAAGDHVLIKVAQMLREVTRGEDLVARLGGDEFVVLLPGVGDYAPLREIADRLLQRLEAPIDHAGSSCRVSASLGATLSRHYAGPTPDRILADADRALYAAKHGGRGRIVTSPGQTGGREA